VSLNEALEKA